MYWIVTVFLAVFIIMTAVPDILQVPLAVSIVRRLGYPLYLLPFLSVAKTLGVIAVLVPHFRTLKEWAYAGLVFDVTGALYSHLSVGDPISAWAPAVIALLLIFGSYALYRKQGSDETTAFVASVDSGHGIPPASRLSTR